MKTPLLTKFLAALWCGSAAVAAVIPNPTITNSPSQFSAAYAATYLFDGTPAFGAATNLGSQWAGSGVGPHTIDFNFGAPRNFGWLAYSQRVGGVATLDKVTSIQFTFSNAADFSNPTVATLPITYTASGNYWAYNLGATYNAQYVRAVFTGNGGNPGGSELRFYEPARTALPNPAIIGTPSQFSAAYAASYLFDGVGEVGLTASNEQWAGSGVGPHTINFDFGAAVAVDSIGYAQRSGATLTVDKVTSIDLFFSDTNGVFAPTPSKTLTITNVSNNTFTEYSLGAAYNGRYLKAVFTGNGGNPGGSELRFYGSVNLNTPIVANTAATSITTNTATVGGQVTRVGITTPNVTLYYGTADGGSNAAAWEQSVVLGPQTGTFSTNLSGLLPFKRYFFRSFAQNTAGPAWAPASLDFATPVGPPSLVNLAASELSIATARAGVTVTNTGGKAPVVTLYYGPTDGGTNAAAWLHQVSLGGVSTTASTILGGLSPGANYYFRCFGVNEGGGVWTPTTASFTTPVATLPVVENLPATQINAFSANLNGRLTSTGNAPTTVSFFYGPTDGGVDPGAWAFSADIGLQAADFAMLVTNLTATTTWSFRVRATNAAGTVWSPAPASFTTTAFAPVVVYLNEFVANTDNDDPHPYCDADGTPQDWIELHNPIGSAVDIGGYYLTDNATRLNKWRFPTPTIIPANGFLVVFASNKNRAISGQELHTNFKLDGVGEYLAMVEPNATTIVKGWPTFPVVPEYWSYGLKPPSSGGVYAPFQIPTPGVANTTTAGAPAGDVVFSIPSQTFATASVALTLTTVSPTAAIYYTTDRSVPTAASTLYTAPITIATTTMIRARAIEATGGFAPGLTHSETYVKLGTAAAAFTSNLPVVLVDDFSAGKPDADKPMFWTVFTPNAATANRTALTNAPVIATRGRMVVRGSSSAAWPKYSLNLEAWDEANEDSAIAPLGMPAEADWVLQSNYDYDRGMIRNPLMYEFSNRIGRWAPHSRFVEVFANTNDGVVDYPGDYLGVYALMEKPERGPDRINIERLDKNDLTGSDVTGGYIVKVDRVDLGTSGWTTSRNFPLTEPFGNEVRLNYGYPEEVPAPGPAIPAAQSAYIRNYIQAFEDAVVQTNRTNPTTGLHYTDYIDRDSWVDHGLLNILAQNADCLRLSTFMHKPKDGKLIAGPIWDFDRTIGSTDSRSASPTGWSAIQPATDILTWGWWKYLWTDPDFWQRFTDRWAELRGGILTNTNITGLVTQYETEINEAAVRNYAKWTTTPPRDGPDAGTTATFSDEMDIVRNWLTQRTAWIDSQFVPQPVRNPAGGQTASVTLTATQGVIYYTLNGTDPRLAGGSINPSALTLASGASITIANSTQLVARAKTATLWSAPATGYYFSGTPAAAGNLVVSELHYHPADPSTLEMAAGFTNSDEFEFIELMNISANSLDLSGSRFTSGVDFTFPLNTVLTAGQRIILVSNRAAFAVRYPAIASSAIVGEYLHDRLENAGELIRLESAAGAEILSFTYGTAGLWPAEADGAGSSLVLVKPSSNPNGSTALNWRASGEVNGSPLSDDSVGYAAWKTAAGIPTDTADDDHDGLSPFLEYAIGSDPAQPALDRLPIVTHDAQGRWTFEVTHALAADDAAFALQTSSELGGWADSAFTIASRVTTGDHERFTCELIDPPGTTRRFVRCRWFVRP